MNDTRAKRQRNGQVVMNVFTFVVMNVATAVLLWYSITERNTLLSYMRTDCTLVGYSGLEAFAKGSNITIDTPYVMWKFTDQSSMLHVFIDLDIPANTTIGYELSLWFDPSNPRTHTFTDPASQIKKDLSMIIAMPIIDALFGLCLLAILLKHYRSQTSSVTL